jgi:hypothetical protein
MKAVEKGIDQPSKPLRDQSNRRGKNVAPSINCEEHQEHEIAGEEYREKSYGQAEQPMEHINMEEREIDSEAEASHLETSAMEADTAYNGGVLDERFSEAGEATPFSATDSMFNISARSLAGSAHMGYSDSLFGSQVEGGDGESKDNNKLQAAVTSILEEMKLLKEIKDILEGMSNNEYKLTKLILGIELRMIRDILSQQQDTVKQVVYWKSGGVNERNSHASSSRDGNEQAIKNRRQFSETREGRLQVIIDYRLQRVTKAEEVAKRIENSVSMLRFFCYRL